MSDRTVHAKSRALNIDVVRYNRAGKWFFEGPTSRQRVTLNQAVMMAWAIAGHGGDVWLGQPGGTAFDRLYQKRTES